MLTAIASALMLLCTYFNSFFPSQLVTVYNILPAQINNGMISSLCHKTTLAPALVKKNRVPVQEALISPASTSAVGANNEKPAGA